MPFLSGGKSLSKRRKNQSRKHKSDTISAPTSGELPKQRGVAAPQKATRAVAAPQSLLWEFSEATAKAKVSPGAPQNSASG